MASLLSGIIRQAIRCPNEPFNVATFPTHESFESGISLSRARFWAFRAPNIKDWNVNYRPIPANYVLLNPERGDSQLPPDVDYDIILSQNKFGQYQKAADLSRRLQLPLISLEHTLPHPSWKPNYIEQVAAMRGHFNVFISEFSRKAWGYEDDSEAIVIHHGIETDVFCPNPEKPKKGHILSVVNDWINRDVFCGYKLWERASHGLPVDVVGDTPGLSKPATSVADLVSHYQGASVFLNTSLVSPVPTSLLEAMSVGLPCVSSATCMIPDIIQHGVNGFLSNDAASLRGYCLTLLADKELAARMGAAARQTILERFSMPAFVENWNRLFERAANHVYVGHP